MRTTTSRNEATNSKLTATLPELMAMLGVGRQTAEQIANASGASIKVGRRRLFIVPKIEAYLNRISQ